MIKSQGSRGSQGSQRSQILEGSQAIAQTIKLCRPAVVSAYPITPQTHIVEDLAKMKAEGEADFEFMRAESEFAAASIVLGASARGVRTYTATASQGLLLMTEVLFNIAGLRLPVVLTCANRAVSAPINIWNDQQDAYTLRDAGWLMFFASSIQKAVDLHILAYKVAEDAGLPVMVNIDGFILTHTTQAVDIPEQKLVNKFLPSYSPQDYLDVNNPKTLGILGLPDYYHEVRMDLHNRIKNQEARIKRYMKEFKQVFGRQLNVINTYRLSDANIVFVSTGSITGTTKAAVNQLRDKGVRSGVLDLTLFRPFPENEISKLLINKKKIIVLNRALSLGAEGILTTEIKKALYGKSKAKIKDEIVGLGGKDVRVGDIIEIVSKF